MKSKALIIVFPFIVGLTMLIYSCSTVELYNQQQAMSPTVDNINATDKRHEKISFSAASNEHLQSPIHIAAEPEDDANTELSQDYIATSDTTDFRNYLQEDQQRFHRYPPNNRQFQTEEQDPVRQRYAVDERVTFNQEKTVSLTLWSDQKFYQKSDPINLYAKVLDAKGNPLQANLQANIYNHGQVGKPVSFQSDRQDGFYSAGVQISDLGGHQSHLGIYKVLVSSPEYQIKDAITFTITKPNIELTEYFRDSLTAEGNLLIEAQVDVSDNARFYFQASLYTQDGKPIGVTENSLMLTAGKHWVPLQYHRQMILDAAQNGPFILKRISLAKATMPMQRAPEARIEYRTNNYHLEELIN